MFFFFKQKTAYEMRISDWSSDVCSSDLKGDEDKYETRKRYLIGRDTKLGAELGHMARGQRPNILGDEICHTFIGGGEKAFLDCDGVAGIELHENRCLALAQRFVVSAAEPARGQHAHRGWPVVETGSASCGERV